MTFFEPCGQRSGGFCSKDDGANIGSILTYNLYALGGKAWKSEFPVLLQFSASSGDLVFWSWLGKFVGRGRLAFLTPATVTVDGVSRRAEVKVEDTLRNHLAKPKTSHKAFRDFLLAWQHDQGPAAVFHQLDTLQVRRWKFKRDVTATKFRVVLDAECSEAFQLSCREKVRIASSKKDEEPAGMFSLSSRSKSSSLVHVGKSVGKGIMGGGDKEPKHSVKKRKGGTGVPIADDSNDDSDDVDRVSSEVHSEYRSNSEDGSSAALSEPEAAADSDDDGVIDEPWNAVGIKSWEHIPIRGNAKCCLCSAPFKSSDSGIRLDFRFKVNNSLRDQKRFHPACSDKLPTERRDRDIRVL
jgi:hypothetical protein